MKTALSFLLLGLAAAEMNAGFQRDVAEDAESRELWHGGCKWVCDDSSPSYYYSKAGMKGGYYSRRAQEKEQTERELPGKGFGGGFYGHHGDCYWDCSYGGGMYGGYGHGGYMCFPTYTDGDYCDCACCGHIPYEESSPSYYVSKAGMKGRKGGYSSSSYYYRRTEETEEVPAANEETAERDLWGKMYGGYGHGVGIMCNCDCDPPVYVSKAGMKGRKGGYYGSSFGYDSSY